ncbi:unnamed protein product [Tenebrio molitor]|nr:unnamed protein product [Tenebrio molitor]
MNPFNLLGLRQIFVISVVASLCASIALISMGFLEIVGDQTVKRAEEKGTIITHLFISLLIFCACNIFILVHVIYITQYVLRGFRYHWHLSCHYFTYIVWEIISVCCIFGKYDYLEHPMTLHILTGVLFVLLFFFNCWAVQLFERLEDSIKAGEEVRKFGTRVGRRPRRESCVRISLREENVDTGASTSGVQNVPNITSSTVSSPTKKDKN